MALPVSDIDIIKKRKIFNTDSEDSFLCFGQTDSSFQKILFKKQFAETKKEFTEIKFC